MRPRNVLLPTLRKQQGKYYIKIFRQFLDQSLWNAYVLYKKQNPTHNIKLLEFRLRMVEESIQKFSDRDNCSGPGRPSSTLNPLRLTARHFASHIPPNPIKRKPQRQFAICCSRKDANGKKFGKKHESSAKTVKLDFALNPVSNSIILN
ncbi:piggyBac transposable element-derived protein 4 [Trichonephila clavipes]|nr:piggyBac transposable element-derived protein 4 [Trichonephila clavipes]